MKILITGATGYLGSALANKLAEQGHHIHAVVRNPENISQKLHPNIKLFKGDITKKESLSDAMNGCSQVYHVAAHVKFFSKDAKEIYTVNVEGTRNMLETALASGVQKFVFTSSCSTLRPLDTKADSSTQTFENDYSLTKKIAENLVIEYSGTKLNTCVASVSKVFGPGNDRRPFGLNHMILKIMKGKTILIPKPGSLHSNFVYINDVVDGLILTMEKGVSGDTYILGGANMSYFDFFNIVRFITGSKSCIIESPIQLTKTWGWLQWVKFKLFDVEPFVTHTSIRHIYRNHTCSSEKTIRELGYKPTEIIEALKETIHNLNPTCHE